MPRFEKISGLVTRVTQEILELHRPVTRGERAAFRVFEFFIVGGLCLFTWTWAGEISRMDANVLQAGSATYADALLDSKPVAWGNAGLITLALGLGWFRILDRYAYLAAVPLIHLQFVACYWPLDGLHHSHWLGLSLLAIGLAFFLFANKDLRTRFALGATYILVGVGYVLSAMSKLRQTGFDWIDGRNLQMFISMNQVHRISKNQSFGLNGLQEWVVNNSWVATFILAPALLIELLGLLICLRRARPYYVTAVISMHLGIAAVMEIYFTWNIALLALIGYPWPAIIDRISGRRKA